MKTHLTLLLLTLLSVAASAQRLRIAQLTDIHLAKNLPQDEAALRLNIERINALDSIDFVLVTGDISEDGDRETLLLAKQHLDKLSRPYYVCMGNHETKWSESGCTAWQEVFGYERFDFTCKGVHFLGFNTGPLMRMAFGHVVAQDLKWLREKLDSYPKDKPVIIVTHYPLISEDMDNWFEVTSLLRKYNVRQCIGGHYHTTRAYSYDGIPGVIMSSCCPGADHNTTFGLYDIDADSIRSWAYEDGKAPVLAASFSMHGPRGDISSQVFPAPEGGEAFVDSTDNTLYNNVRREWLLRTDASIYSSPAVEGKRLFVGDDTGILTSYSLRDGKTLWTFPTGARIVGTPAVSNGIVVVGSADSHIYALRAKDGRLLWKVQAQAPVLGAVSISGGVAYVGDGGGRMYALSLKDGREVWTYSKAGGYIETRPLVTPQHIVFGAWDNTLYCLSRDEGKLLWTWKIDKPGTHYSPAAVWPVETDGRVFITDPTRAITAIDGKTGNTLWRTFQSRVRETITLSRDCSRLFSKTMNDSLVCYSTDGDAPREIWACNVGYGYDHAPSMPQELDGVVYGSCARGTLFAVDAATGRLLWRHKEGTSLISTVVPLPKRRLLFTSSDGRVGLLRWDDK